MIGVVLCPSDPTQRRRLATDQAVVAGALAVVAALAAAGAGRLRRVRVEGASMEPTLADGDRLLVLAGRRPRPGAVVAVRDPRAPEGRLMVKRVLAVGPRGVDVRGDAPGRSTDSRSFGPVPEALVEGQVVWRYGPAERAGRLPRRVEPGRQ